MGMRLMGMRLFDGPRCYQECIRLGAARRIIWARQLSGTVLAPSELLWAA